MISQIKDFENIHKITNTYIQNAIYSAFMLTNLVNDLLDSAKLQEHVFQLDNEWFNLHEVVEEAFQIVLFSAQSKQITLVQEIDVS